MLEKNTPTHTFALLSGSTDSKDASITAAGAALDPGYAPFELVTGQYPGGGSRAAYFKKTTNYNQRTSAHEYLAWRQNEEKRAAGLDENANLPYQYADTMVVFFNANQRRKRRIIIQDGKLLRGRKLSANGTAGLHTTFNGECYGNAIFVLVRNPESGALCLFEGSHDRGTHQHLSKIYASTKDRAQVGVLGAAIMSVNTSGQVTLIRGFTGHFTGCVRLALNTLLYLHGQGADLSMCKIDMRHYQHAKAELALQKTNFSQDLLPEEDQYLLPAVDVVAYLIQGNGVVKNETAQQRYDAFIASSDALSKAVSTLCKEVQTWQNQFDSIIDPSSGSVSPTASTISSLSNDSLSAGSDLSCTSTELDIPSHIGTALSKVEEMLRKIIERSCSRVGAITARAVASY